MTLTVTATLTYKVHCPACIKDAERIIGGALRDAQVTSVKMLAVPKCDHAPMKQERLPEASENKTAASEELFPTDEETSLHMQALAL